MTDNPLQEGMMGGWQNRMKRDESFASVKVAEWGGGFGLDLSDQAPVPTHKFIIDANGQVFSKPEPTHHEDIAVEHGLLDRFPHKMSLGLLKSDGSTDWYSHENGLDAGTLAQTLEGHFKQPITIDPNLKPTTSEERFQIPDEGQYADHEKVHPGEFRDKVRREQDLVQQRGRPFGYYDNPVFNRGGSLDQTIHAPWGLEKSAGLWDTVKDVGSDIGDAAGDAAGAVGDAAGAVGDAGAWAGNEIAQHPVDAALTAAMFVPGIGTTLGVGGKLLEGALAGSRALRGGEAVAEGVGAAEGAGAAAGAGEAAGAGAADAAESGGAMSKLKGLVKGSPKALGRSLLVHGLTNSLLGNGQQGQVQDPGAGGMLNQTPTLQQVSRLLLADTDTPTSLKDIPGADSDDPEDADTQEFTDGSDTTNPENAERDEAGGADGPADKQDNDTPGIALLKHLWPYALAHYVSDESGADDPLIKALDDALEKDHPGYKDKGKDFNLDGLIEHFVGGHLKSQKHAALPPAPGLAPTMPSAAVPGIAPPQVGPNPQLHTCPVCGSLLDASGVCQQCGFGGQGQPQAQQINRAVTPGNTAKVADTQGPITPEQQKLVAQFLIEHGRSAEIPTMLDPNTSWQYADVLQQIQRRVETPAPPVAVPSQPPPPPGAMPGMDPSAGAAPAPDPSQQVAAAVARFAADNIAPKCPKCGSHTTGIVGEGTCRCHACGNQFPVGVVKAAEHFDHQDLHATPVEDVDNDSHEDADPDEATYNWETTDGSRLEPGKEYEMHSENYSVPDIVKVVAVKPDELVYRIEGEFADLEDEGTIDRQTAKLEGLTFVPVDNADVTPDSPNPESQPRVNTEPTPASAVPTTSSTQPVFDFSASTETPVVETPQIEVAGAEWLLEGTRSAGQVPAPWENPLPDLTGGEIKPEASDADWLLDGVPASRVAGAKFSPQQQREFIDEDGEARNLDRLDLDNTHYKTRETSVFVAGRGAHRHAQPEMIREDDFALGF